MEKKKKKKWPLVVGVIVVVFIIISVASGDKPDNATPGSESQSTVDKKPEDAKKQDTAKAQPIPYEAQLQSGNYTAGIDFPAGKYNIEAVSGGGNVSTSNMYSGGMNAVMGTAEAAAAVGSSDFYEQTYANVDLSDGVVLSISGVGIKIASEAASAKPLTLRNQTITAPVDLASGNFVSGQDFPAGTYDIVATSKSGNVSSDNMFEGGINAVLGVDTSDGISELGYKNISLPDGSVLTISGVGVQLIPSK